MVNRIDDRSALPIRAPRPTALAAAVAAVVAASGVGPAYAQEGQQVEEVVVTGSRIARRDFTAASPIVTVDSELFENRSTIGVESALNQLPQFQPAGTQFVTGDVQASAFNNPGISSVNLRGLGSNRNLVLINGRRPQPANATLVVDVNTIPAAAIQNVEVITGGASAVYGADAIAGVVNFITRNDFEGLDFDLQTGITQEGDGEETRFSMLIGGDIGEGGNVMLGLEWANREPVFLADRDFYTEGWADPGTPGDQFWIQHTAYAPQFGIPGNFPTQQAVNTVFADQSMPGSPNTYFFINPDLTVFQEAGALSYTGPVGPGTLWKINSYTGRLSEIDPDGYASSPLDRSSLFGRASHPITDNISAFAQVNFASIDVNSILQFSPATEFWVASIPRDAEHPVPPELAALLDSRPVPQADWSLRRVLTWLGPRRSENGTNVYQLMAGLEGRLPNRDWTWEAYVSQGETDVTNVLDGFASVERWREVVQAPFYGRGYRNSNPALGYEISCTSGLPIFDYSIEVTQDCIDAMSVRMKNTTSLEQDIAEFNLQGGITEIRGGELRFAVGAAYRENDFLFEPDILNDEQSIVDNPVGLFGANEAGGSIDVSEIYGELLVPLAQRFNLELGVRSSDYSTAGTVKTYKALFDFLATDRLRIRGGRQIANRAPNTAELFLGDTLAVVGFPGGDPCTTATLNPWGNVPSNPNRAQVQALCSALINNPGSAFDADPNNFGFFFPLELEVRQGNEALATEEAETYTLGVVYDGDAITAALDFYDIEVKDAITPLSSYTVYQQCFNANGTSNPTYSIDDPGGFCRLITRQASGERLQVEAPYFNLGSIRTSGVDVQVNWNGQLRDNGIFVNSVLNYVNEYETQATPTSPFLDAVGTLAEGGQFEWRLFTTVGYTMENFDFGLRWRHLPSADDATAVTNPATTVLGVDAYDLFDFFGGWNVNETIAVRFGIDNLFDEEPEIVGANPGVTNARGTTNPGFYDVLGRRVFVGVNFNF